MLVSFSGVIIKNISILLNDTKNLLTNKVVMEDEVKEKDIKLVNPHINIIFNMFKEDKD